MALDCKPSGTPASLNDGGSLFAALDFAARGFRVFRLPPGKKSPPWDGKPSEAATSDEMELFTRWYAGKKTAGRYNIGVCTDDIVVIDVDAHKGGMDSLAALGLPPTLTTRTPRDGRHLYFLRPGGIRFANSACRHGPDEVCDCRLGRGIDIRACGGYVLAPGSSIEQKGVGYVGAYTIELDVPMAVLPEHIAAKLTAARERNEVRIVGELDTDASVAAAAEYLKTSAPLAVEGSGGDATTYVVCCRVLDFGVSPETAFELLSEHWNQRCAPPWDPEDLERKVLNAAQYRTSPIGTDNPVLGFGPVKRLPAKAPESNGLLEYARDVSLEDIKRRQSNALLKGLLLPGETAMIYGESTAGKTFAALDLAWHLALGKDWHGTRVTRVPVLYVSLEGVDGFRKRMLAATKKFGDPGDHFARLTISVSLVKAAQGREGAEKIIQAFRELCAKAGVSVGLIIIDTLARAMAGDDENATSDMMHFIEQRTAYIARTTGAAVAVVHHTNRSGDFRGNSSAKASCDLVLRVDKRTEGRRLAAEKVKDGAERVLFDYQLETVFLGLDNDGEQITSCVVHAIPPADTALKVGVTRDAKQKKGPRNVRIFREAFDACLSAGRTVEITIGDSALTTKAVPLSALRDEFLCRYVVGESNNKTAEETKKRKWRSALQGLPEEFDTRSVDGCEYIWRHAPLEPTSTDQPGADQADEADKIR